MADFDEIVYGLANSLNDHLQDKMVDNIPEIYASYLVYTDQDGAAKTFAPSFIKVGRIQEDPTDLVSDINEPSVYIRIAPNDPTDLSYGWRHGVISGVDVSATNLGLRLGYAYELGGGSLWWRRFLLQSAMFFLYSNQDEEAAAQIANMNRVMLERCCSTYREDDNPHGWRVGGLTDGFGETALESHVASVWTKQRGGPDTDYIWDIRLWLQVLTERA